MKRFEELGLQEELLKAIAELGFEWPMPVQEEVIPLLLEGERDIIALAQTGTGKTAAFGLPLLQMLVTQDKSTQVLILSPTHELCIQIADDLKDYSKYLDDVRILSVYGGSSMRNQIEGLQKGVQVIVATPGRLQDLMERGFVDLSKVRKVVLDEADEMLDMGFSEDIDNILGAVPEERRLLLFSATMPEEIERISRQYMLNPKEVVIGKRNESAASVRHIYYMVQAKEKYQTLKRIVDYYPRIYGIVFCRTKVETQEISDRLIRDGYNVDALHGDLSQSQRDYVMQRFRLRNIQLLVATDVAARGLDVEDLTHIINYTLPDDVDTYTHRSGRTGRAGKTGISIAIINMHEARRIREIEKGTGKTFEVGSIPTGKEICSKQIFSLMDRIEKVEVNDEEIAQILPSVFRKLEWLDKEDIIRRLVTLEFDRILRYYKENEDFEATVQKKRVDVSGPEAGYTKVFVSLGRMDEMNPKNLLGLVNRCVGEHVDIGRIDIFTRYSLLDVKSESVVKVIDELGSLRIKGRTVRAQIATKDQMERGKEKPARPKSSSERRTPSSEPQKTKQETRKSTPNPRTPKRQKRNTK